MLFFNRLKNEIELISELGKRGYIRYRTAKSGEAVSLNIKCHPILIRKGTPDLTVAISCFSGEFEALRYLFPEKYDGIIVDAGGYIGTSAIVLHEMFPNAQIIVVEPSKKNIAILRQNLAKYSKIQIVYGALVGKSTDFITLKNRGTGEWGFTVVDKPMDNKDATLVQETPAHTLSQLVEDVARIGILKLDIEGGEADLLINDKKSLNMIKALFVELHDRIVDGCSDHFFEYSQKRIVVNCGGEKYLSVKV